MASSVQTLNKPIVREKWSVAIPTVVGSLDSDIFRLEGKAWKFRLETRLDSFGTVKWSMNIMKCDGGAIYEKLWLAVYVDIGTSVYLLSHKEISTSSDPIWTNSQATFLESYPSIATTGTINFSFEIVNPRKIFQILADELPPTPSYLDDRLCLDDLSLALRKLVDEGSDSDVQVKCGECSIAAHKLILGTRSEVFRTMLQSDMLEGRQGVVEIVDMEPKVCEIFVRYLYTGSLPVLTEDTATSLYEAADKYRVEALRARCGDFLAGNLTRENALRILAMAEAHSDKSLTDKGVTYVLDENIPISNEDEWSKFCDDYPKLAIEVLMRSYKQFVSKK